MTQQNATIHFETNEAVEQYAACTISSTLAINADAVTETVFGVAQEGGADGDEVNFVVAGKTKCLVNGSGTAIAAGDELSPSTADGVLIKHDGVSNTRYVARALEAATGNGDIIWVYLYGYQPQA